MFLVSCSVFIDPAECRSNRSWGQRIFFPNFFLRVIFQRFIWLYYIMADERMDRDLIVCICIRMQCTASTLFFDRVDFYRKHIICPCNNNTISYLVLTRFTTTELFFPAVFCLLLQRLLLYFILLYFATKAWLVYVCIKKS